MEEEEDKIKKRKGQSLGMRIGRGVGEGQAALPLCALIFPEEKKG